MSKVEFCYVDERGIHNKLYEDVEKDKLVNDVKKVRRLKPSASIRLLGINAKTKKPETIIYGNSYPWKQTELTVDITFNGEGPYTYITSKYVKIGKSFKLRTRYGVKEGFVASDCFRRTLGEISTIAASCGYSKLVLLQDVIVEEGDKK